MKAESPPSTEDIQRRLLVMYADRAELSLELKEKYLSTGKLMRNQTECTLAAVCDFLNYNRLEVELRQKNHAQNEMQTAFDNCIIVSSLFIITINFT
jgi:hypothetical protein